MAHASWLDEIYTPKARKSVIRQLVNEIRKDKKNFKIDYIVVTGISGVAIGGIISYLTGIPLMVSRKADTYTHSEESLEYNEEYLPRRRACNWIFIDDLISSGDTLRRVENHLDSKLDRNILKKIYLYHSRDIKTYANYPVFVCREE